MAFQNADRAGRRFLKHHLGDDMIKIAEAASWADSDDAKARYPDSEDFHFSHTPFKSCAKFDMKRDCGFGGSGRCLITGIAQMVMRAIDPSLPVIERGDALKFVLHLVADIHQPLHTGFARDAGGNNIHLDTDPAMSLHQFWDLGLMQNVSVIGQEIFGDAKSEDSKIPSLGDRIVSHESILNFAAALATESTTMYTCKHAYTTETGRYILSNEALTNEYLESRSVIIRGRIRDAIARLTRLVNLMGATFFERKSAQFASKKTKPNSKFLSGSDTNTFSTLAIDFDIDEVVDLCQESQALLRLVPSPVVTTSTGAKMGEKSDYELLEDAIAVATIERLEIESQAVMNRVADSTNEVYTNIGGVDLDSITLVRIDRGVMITRKDILAKDPLYEALRVAEFNVQLVYGKRNRFERFLIDALIFKGYQLGVKDCEIILRYLKNGEVQKHDANRGVKSVSKLNSGIGLAYDGDAGRVVVDGYINFIPARINATRTESVFKQWEIEYINACKHSYDYWSRNIHIWSHIAQMWDHDFYTKIRDIVMVSKGNIRGYFLKTDVVNLIHRRLNVYKITDTESSSVNDDIYALIDTRIFEGALTPRIRSAITNAGFNMKMNSDPITKSSRVQKEIQDLSKVLSRDQSGNRKMKIIKNLILAPCPYDIQTSVVIEYDLEKIQVHEDI